MYYHHPEFIIKLKGYTHIYIHIYNLIKIPIILILPTYERHYYHHRFYRRHRYEVLFVTLIVVKKNRISNDPSIRSFTIKPIIDPNIANVNTAFFLYGG